MAVRNGVPVAATDTVSDVLARDEELVAVFERHAPHFAKLRNRAMRRVMARLVTVEQAARMANVAVDRLLDDLNEALGVAPDAQDTRDLAARAIASGDDPVRRHPPSAPVLELDVRDDLRSGREPFSRIMSAVGELREGSVLRLRATFEPVPLFGVLAKRGFIHESVAHALDDWSVWFWRPRTPVPELAAEDRPAVPDDLPPGDERTTYLDVRGFSPPEPMMRTLAALESLEHGRALVQVNDRVPQFLLPVLVERGFAYEIDESRPDRVLVRIAHAP